WHRVAISMQKAEVRLFVDCRQRESVAYNRTTITVDSRGRMRVLKDGIQGAIQDLFVAPTADIASKQCDVYTTDCLEDQMMGD
ncbi:hypothetical protein X801_08151, partial [Opisthorchis viverrini]